MKKPEFDNLNPEEKKRLIEERQMASISTSTSKTLAAHVIVYRALGMNKDIAIACMQELAKRKNDGDDFDFEDFIDNELKKIPKQKNTDYAQVIRDMYQNFSNSFIKGK